VIKIALLGLGCWRWITIHARSNAYSQNTKLTLHSVERLSEDLLASNVRSIVHRLFTATFVRNATYRPDAVAVHGLTAEFLADNPLFDHVASKGHLTTASNQIFLIVDAGTPVAAFTARHELKAFLQRRRDAFTNPLVYTF
jgi:hypothetical protein